MFKAIVTKYLLSVVLSWILLFASSLNLYAINEKCNMLEYAKMLVEEKGEETDDKNRLVERLDSLMSCSKIDEKSYVMAVMSVGTLFRKQGNINYAVELYLEIVSCYEQEQSLTDMEKRSLVKFYIPLGASHEELGMWNKAMDYYMKALSIAENLGMEANKAMLYNNIANVYIKRKELDRAEEFLQKSLSINRVLQIKEELFVNYNNLGHIYFERKDYDKSLDYALQALQQLDSMNDAYYYYFEQTNIAELYICKKDYRLAVSYLRNAMIHQEKFGFNSDLVQTYLVLGTAFNEMGGKVDSVYFYLEKALELSRTLGNRYEESAILKRLAGHYKEDGYVGKAYNALLRSVQINDSIQEIDNSKKMADMEKIYNADHKVREKELLIKDITLKKMSADRLWITMASVAVLLVLVILFLINRVRSKVKEKETQRLLAEQRKAIYEQEKELQLKKEQELNFKIDQRNRELTTYTLYMVKINEFIADVGEELKQLLLELNPRDKEHKQHLRLILNKLQQHNSTSNWEEFRYYFEQVHPSFYENLEKLHPDLTIKEKRLCAFLRLGLSSKDISAITFKEVRSVESARNRLRKKIDIPADENLTDFLTRNYS